MEHPNIVFMVTCADIPTKKEIRNTEYSLCLAKIQSYNIPMYCVVSETNKINTPFSNFLFEKIISIPSTNALKATTKSQKEFISLKHLISSIDLDDTTFVIKMTGRYLLVDDTFFNTVKNASSDIDAIALFSDKHNQIRTFIYAIRWKILKQYFSNNIEYLGKECIENSMYTFLKKIKANCINVNHLGVYADINNEGKYLFF